MSLSFVLEHGTAQLYAREPESLTNAVQNELEVHARLKFKAGNLLLHGTTERQFSFTWENIHALKVSHVHDSEVSTKLFPVASVSGATPYYHRDDFFYDTAYGVPEGS